MVRGAGAKGNGINECFCGLGYVFMPESFADKTRGLQ